MESILAGGLGLSLAWGYLVAMFGKDSWLIPPTVAAVCFGIALAFQQGRIVCVVS